MCLPFVGRVGRRHAHCLNRLFLDLKFLHLVCELSDGCIDRDNIRVTILLTQHSYKESRFLLSYSNSKKMYYFYTHCRHYLFILTLKLVIAYYNLPVRDNVSPYKQALSFTLHQPNKGLFIRREEDPRRRIILASYVFCIQLS